MGVDEDDVTPAASLLGDLGAESIDLLDIAFRLERQFAIAVPGGDVFIEPARLGEADYVRDGRLTNDGRSALRARMPYADLTGLESDKRLDSVNDMFTVDLLVCYIAWKMESPPDPAQAAATKAR